MYSFSKVLSRNLHGRCKMRVSWAFKLYYSKTIELELSKRVVHVH
ncbi:F1L3.9 [Arabidopsis thaliana]|uniref:F1L3.9 n=1 Tax=Arabidopsis thaliana TaxID=3702 RepID=Q9LNR5_ARATH|nr:F1L3.9 [Arabidopsis thaliana]